MFRLRVESEFDAAHKIEGYPGKCANLHGHTYRVEAFFLSEKLDSIGVSADLRTLKEELLKITEQFDHTCLNDCKELKNPTTENLSRYIYEKIKTDLPKETTVEKVRVWETPKTWCEYFETKSKE
ncbi:MAG: 6-carboxytetrahydropterin synthase QueD [Candidatus Bathyarchaeota archaeon]|nr:6-carboxytetrahydropterin synthase QueD [Candidatus Bathyarchaeota archaeon]